MANKTGDLLISHGALKHNIYYANELTGYQGTMGLLNLFEVEEDEEVMLGQSIFKDQDHYHLVMKNTGSNDMVHYLNHHIKDIIEIDKIISSKFKMV